MGFLFGVLVGMLVEEIMSAFLFFLVARRMGVTPMEAARRTFRMAKGLVA